MCGAPLPPPLVCQQRRSFRFSDDGRACKQQGPHHSMVGQVRQVTVCLLTQPAVSHTSSCVPVHTRVKPLAASYATPCLRLGWVQSVGQSQAHTYILTKLPSFTSYLLDLSTALLLVCAGWCCPEPRACATIEESDRSCNPVAIPFCIATSVCASNM